MGVFLSLSLSHKTAAALRYSSGDAVAWDSGRGSSRASQQRCRVSRLAGAGEPQSWCRASAASRGSGQVPRAAGPPLSRDGSALVCADVSRQICLEGEPVPKGGRVPQAYWWCAGGTNVLNCSSRCGRGENGDGFPFPERRKCFLSPGSADVLHAQRSSTSGFCGSCAAAGLYLGAAVVEKRVSW